jgi:uncharacterized membrane protein YgaE (UPF0421/DUF939 family)
MRLSRANWIYALALAAACLVTWLISEYAFYRVFDSKLQLLGSMWAVIATIFVLKESRVDSIRAGVIRIAATVSSVVICWLYFLLLPFNPIAMAMLIALGYLVANAVGRPEDAITTGITIAVVMVVGGLDPATASLEPWLRLGDTLIGAAVAVAVALAGRQLWDRPGEVASKA